MVEINALRQPEIKELIQSSYQMILEKLPKKAQSELGAKRSPKAIKAGPRRLKAKPLRAVKRRK